MQTQSQHNDNYD